MKSIKYNETQSKIKCISISKSFGEKKVLENICFEIDYGSTVFVKGASGMGKTTLLRIIAGLEVPDSGSIIGIDGKQVAFLFQEDRLFPWMTALQNVETVITDKSDRHKAKEILSELGMGKESDLRAYPHELSGGMSRRVAIARTLAFDADIVILDEAIRGLDAENVEKTVAVIKKYTEGKTLITVSHTPSSLEENCDQIICL